MREEEEEEGRMSWVGIGTNEPDGWEGGKGKAQEKRGNVTSNQRRERGDWRIWQ